MNLYEYQRSRSSKVSQVQHFQTSFAQKPLGWLKSNFIWSLHGMWGMKICSNVPGHMTMPTYGKKKNFKNLLFRIHEADDLETWYTGSGPRVLPMFSCDDPGLTLTIFWQCQICFRLLLHRWTLIQHWVLMYFQVYSNSAYPQHSDERYRANGPLVSFVPCIYLPCWLIPLIS